MRSALIGHTGFVGGVLAQQRRFDACFNSANIHEIEGQRFDLVVCSGARAEKWRINKDPGADTADLGRLTRHLASVDAKQVVLVSTVDVYPAPIGVDEDTWIDPLAGAPYGAHRLALEHFVATRFPTLVLRLPGLFGPGLKKNVIYDFLHDNMLDRVHADSAFQFYDLAWLWGDIERALGEGVRLLNLATEPVTVRQVARQAFGRTFDGAPPGSAPARYDFRSRHAARLGGRDGYLYDAEQVLAAMQQFVAAERGQAV
jgi:nucleoside-diphosphate-sugar epimerase